MARGVIKSTKEQFQNCQKDKSYFYALVCMYTVDLKIECQVISAREIPRHNNSDNDLTKLGS
ncbi:hypothetical protein T4C_4919 [Trichinella pseudospiralis]|uniref:Uncharacterized protein n=1 Tax=Trichinella pseudospiralis TaxID=6337 RepID=A0A0V1GF81_TRIPS|nr:hypothetical protein T4C_4919 [Trichinella pseudospiralis]